MNPFSALAEFVLGKMKQSAMALWMKLLFQLAFSAIASFLFTAGSVMVTTRSVSLGVGSGMVMAALVLTVLFRRSPLTKGMMAVLPGEEAAKEIETAFQTIQK